jgi:hypothetical protein
LLREDIVKGLERGRVPPIFHALLMRKPCVAFRHRQGDQNTKDLRSERVESGRLSSPDDK